MIALSFSLPARPRTQTPADAYRRLLIAMRGKQLTQTQAHVRRLAETYDRAAQSLFDQLLGIPAYLLTPEGALQQAHARQVLNGLSSILTDLAADTNRLMVVSMLDLAQTAAERERKAAEIVGAANDARLKADFTHTVTLSNRLEVSVQFGRVARAAVQAAADRYYRDGLRLAGRLANLDRSTRKAVEDVIVQGVAEQISAQRMAERLKRAFAERGRDVPRYQALRIAATEINNAHREATVGAAYHPGTVRLKDHLLGLRWSLSNSHKAPDICDLYAAHEEGLGAGVYLPQNVPVDHPHGLCVVSPVLKAFPEVGLPASVPDAEGVPESMVRYYAERGDAVARRALERRRAA